MPITKASITPRGIQGLSGLLPRPEDRSRRRPSRARTRRSRPGSGRAAMIFRSLVGRSSCPEIAWKIARKVARAELPGDGHCRGEHQAGPRMPAETSATSRGKTQVEPGDHRDQPEGAVDPEADADSRVEHAVTAVWRSKKWSRKLPTARHRRFAKVDRDERDHQDHHDQAEPSTRAGCRPNRFDVAVARPARSRRS